MSNRASESRGGRADMLMSLLRWLLDTRERRARRREMRRLQWIYEARTAPTNEEYIRSH